MADELVYGFDAGIQFGIGLLPGFGQSFNRMG